MWYIFDEKLKKITTKRKKEEQGGNYEKLKEDEIIALTFKKINRKNIFSRAMNASAIFQI